MVFMEAVRLDKELDSTVRQVKLLPEAIARFESKLNKGEVIGGEKFFLGRSGTVIPEIWDVEHREFIECYWEALMGFRSNRLPREL